MLKETQSKIKKKRICLKAGVYDVELKSALLCASLWKRVT